MLTGDSYIVNLPRDVLGLSINMQCSLFKLMQFLDFNFVCVLLDFMIILSIKTALIVLFLLAAESRHHLTYVRKFTTVKRTSGLSCTLSGHCLLALAVSADWPLDHSG